MFIRKKNYENLTNENAELKEQNKKLQEQMMNVNYELIALKKDNSVDFVKEKCFDNIQEIDPKIANELNLVEISDFNFMSRVNMSINMSIPNAIDISINSKNLVNNVQPLYKAIISDGVLAQSRSLPGAFRGIVLGQNGIQENANFVIANSGGVPISAVMIVYKIAAIVVGLHYMDEISKKYESMNNSLKSIYGLIINEYLSKLEIININVDFIIKNKDEILFKDELRSRELDNLEKYEFEVETLLIQCTYQINKLLKDNEKLVKTENKKAKKSAIKSINKGEYDEFAEDVSNWLGLADYAKKVYEKIIISKYILNFGTISRNYCNDKLKVITNRINKCIDNVVEWNKPILDLPGDEPAKSSFIESLIGKLAVKLNKKIDSKQLNLLNQLLHLEKVEVNDQFTNSLNIIEDDKMAIYIKDGKYYLCK
jgi:hypothetical protein